MIRSFRKRVGGKCFSKIDLTQAYLQVELHEESKKYLVVNTSKGLKEYDKMPYGAKTATGVFQRYMAGTLSNVEKTVVRVDDVLTTGADDEEHLKHLEEIFQALKVQH